MSIRLIAIDIDGTLMPSSGPEISQGNCAALRAAEAAGVEVVIATGRRHAYAMPLIVPIGLSLDSIMVSSNGAVTRRFHGELMDRRFLSSETAHKLCGELRSHGTLLFTFDRDGSPALVIENLKPLHAQLGRWLEANSPHIQQISPLELAFAEGELPIQGMVSGGVEQMKLVEEALRDRGLHNEVSMHRTEYPARDLSMLDLLPLDCSKGTALHQLAQLRGLRREEIMAIGDNLNDVEMLEYAGRAVVMANAGEEMMAIASARGWERANANDDDGVALVIDEVLRETRSSASASRDLSRNGSSPSPKPLDVPLVGNTENAKSEDTMTGWKR